MPDDIEAAIGTITANSAALGWAHDPPRHILERSYLALRARADGLDEFEDVATVYADELDDFHVNGPIEYGSCWHYPGSCAKFTEEANDSIRALCGPYVFRPHVPCDCSLGTLTVVATGTVDVAGTSSPTLGALTVVADGTVV